VSIRDELVSRHDDYPLRRKLYQTNRTDSNLILVGRVFVMLKLQSIVLALDVRRGGDGLFLLGAA